MNKPRTAGQILIEARKALGWKAGEFAFMIRTNIGYWISVEKDKSPVRFGLGQAVLDLLKVSPEDRNICATQWMFMSIEEANKWSKSLLPYPVLAIDEALAELDVALCLQT